MIFCYAIGPIDFWTAWVKPDSLFGPHDGAPDREEFEDWLVRAEGLARDLGWEGDRTVGPLVAGLPGETPGGDFMVGWKQSNNGATFIASPYQLPWLGSPGALEPSKGENSEKLLWANSQWAVTARGLDCIERGTPYQIDCELLGNRLDGEPGQSAILAQMASKRWVDHSSFVAAFRAALRIHRGKFEAFDEAGLSESIMDFYRAAWSGER